MNKRALISILIALMFLITSVFTYCNDSYVPIKLENSPPNIHIEIKPEIELLAGILSHTS